MGGTNVEEEMKEILEFEKKLATVSFNSHSVSLIKALIVVILILLYPIRSLYLQISAEMTRECIISLH